MEERAWRVLSPAGPTWLLLHRSLDVAVIPRPGPVAVMFKESHEAEEIWIGTLNCGLVEPAALTPERVAAIRSDPRAAKQVRIVLGCKKCPSKLAIVAAIERPHKPLDGGAIWYEEAPRIWTCSCGESMLDLSTIGNLHGVLGTRIPEGSSESSITFVQMYERGALADVCANFGALLDENPNEEAVQAFLERHPVLLHTFNTVKSNPKAPILTKHRPDITILDSRGMLILVKLEKPGIRLLRKDGDTAQDLQHAFSQARNWLHTVNHHWAAALECMGFNADEVAGAKAVVIAGRDAGYGAEPLMRLKGVDQGQVDFYTYDDILESTVGLARNLV